MITRTDLLDKLQNGAVWNTGVTFERTNPVPIEKYSIFATLAEAQTYAFENPVAYPGQTLAVVTDTNEVTLYIVQAGVATKELSLIEVGSATLGDGVSVELDTTNKVIKLKDFGQFYYKEVSTTTNEGDEEVTTITYEKVTGFKAGLEPKVRLTDDGKYELAWYEPSSITVEGLSARINGLTETVGTIESVATDAQTKANKNASDITEMDATVDNHETRLTQAEADITTIKTTHYTKEQVDKLIGDQSHFTTQIVETTAQVTTAGILYLIKNPTVTGQDVYYEYIFVDGEGAVCIGDTTTDLANYYNKTEVDTLLSGKANSGDVNSSIQSITTQIQNVDKKFENYTTSADLATELAKYDTSAQVDAKVKVATDAAAKNAEDISGLNTTVNNQGSTISQHTQDISDVNTRVDNVNDEIANIKTSITNLGDTYATDAELAAVKQELQTVHSTDMDAVNAALNGKADASNVYSKDDVDTKFSDYDKSTVVDSKIKEIFGESDNLADYITDNRDIIGGLLSTEDKAVIDGIDSRLNALKINSTSEITATANETGGVDLTLGEVAVSKLKSDITLYLNCGDATTV